MKISDLIVHLLKFPQDLTVLVRESEFYEYGLSKRQVKKMVDGTVSYLIIDLIPSEIPEGVCDL